MTVSWPRHGDRVRLHAHPHSSPYTVGSAPEHRLHVRSAHTFVLSNCKFPSRPCPRPPVASEAPRPCPARLIRLIPAVRRRPRQVSVADGVTVLSAGAAGTDARHITCELVFQVSPLLASAAFTPAYLAAGFGISKEPLPSEGCCEFAVYHRVGCCSCGVIKSYPKRLRCQQPVEHNLGRAASLASAARSWTVGTCRRASAGPTACASARPGSASGSSGRCYRTAVVSVPTDGLSQARLGLEPAVRLGRAAEVLSTHFLCLGGSCRAVSTRRRRIPYPCSIHCHCLAIIWLACVQVDVIESSTTACGSPTALLRLRPRQLPSFLVTLRATAARPALHPAHQAVGPSAAVTVPATPAPASLPPPSPAGSRLSELRLSPATGDMLNPRTPYNSRTHERPVVWPNA